MSWFQKISPFCISDVAKILEKENINTNVGKISKSFLTFTI